MVNANPHPTVLDRANEPSQAIFHQAWRIYRTLVDENYLFHREAAACLHRILVEEVARPFRFLDVACGDATATVDALTGTAIAQYYGIDLSEAALTLAGQSLAALDCPVTLDHADFVAALPAWSRPVDVVWIGLSLHHLRTPEKREVLRAIRALLGAGGLLLLYEDTSPDGEDRAGWLTRWDAQEPAWTACSADDWQIITGHVHAADFPETASGWLALGAAAGFATVREVYVSPSNLFRLYAMGPDIERR
jgi:SAM-dependent methyltransferase